MVNKPYFIGISSEYFKKIPRTTYFSSEFPHNFLRIFRGNSEEHKTYNQNLFFLTISSEFSEAFPKNTNPIIKSLNPIPKNMFSSAFHQKTPTDSEFLGISSEIFRNIPKSSFSIGTSVRITLFSCSG